MNAGVPRWPEPVGEGLGRWNRGELQWLGVRVLVHIVELFKDFEQGVGDINLVTPVQGRGYTSVPYSGPWMPFCYGESVFVLSPLGRTCHAI